MSMSAFGVDHGDISKADKYRDSYLNSMNQRSDTKVKRGTAPRRYAKVVGGEVGGAVAGSVIGGLTKNPNIASASGTAGALLGASAGRTSNLKRGDVVATNRKTGKKAKRYTGFGPGNFGIGGYSY